MKGKRMKEIEEEFGEPFWDVVQGFADMGYSERTTAGALDYNLRTFQRLQMRNGDPVDWPDKGDTVDEAMQLVRQGMSYREIAKRYRVTSSTVSYWVDRYMERVT